MPVVRGHALAMPANYGGTAQNDRRDAHTMAGLLRGGRLPQTYANPAAMRATRDRRRRRMPLMRTHAAA
jgi:hypothetical protein